MKENIDKIKYVAFVKVNPNFCDRQFVTDAICQGNANWTAALNSSIGATNEIACLNGYEWNPQNQLAIHHFTCAANEIAANVGAWKYNGEFLTPEGAELLSICTRTLEF